MASLLTSIAPPLVGAFIGYMTNHIAIRMLFRPLRPWRLFGIRVPLTPGVIPSRRRQLADNIGEMVGAHLLTSADIQQGIQDAGFQTELSRLIESRVETVMDRELGPLPELVPARFRSYFDAGVKILRWRALKLLHTFLESDTFASRLQTVTGQSADSFLARQWDQILDSKTTEELLGFLENSISRLFDGPEVEDWITGEIHRLVDDIRAGDKSLADLLPDEAIKTIGGLVATELPGLLENLAELLQKPDVRRRVSEKIAGILQSFVQSMGPLAALVGNFLSPEAMAEKIETYLETHADEIAGWLFDTRTQRRLTELARQKVDVALNLPLSRLFDRLGPERMTAIEKKSGAFLASQLASPRTAARLTAMLRIRIDEARGRTLADVLGDTLGRKRLNDAREWFGRELITAARSSGFRRFLDGLVADLVENRLLTRPIGPLREFLPRAVREGIGAYLQQQINDLLVREVPGLVDSLNIRAIIARKVNSLDLLRLEDLLMGIMREQFKYINLFGGLLGFIIGLVNLLFL